MAWVGGRIGALVGQESIVMATKEDEASIGENTGVQRDGSAVNAVGDGEGSHQPQDGNYPDFQPPPLYGYHVMPTMMYQDVMHHHPYVYYGEYG